MSRALLVAFAFALPPAAPGARAAGDGPALRNPYFQRCEWRLWREDDSPVTDARVVVPPATAPPSTIVLPPEEKRLWPLAKPAKGRFFELSNRPAREFAGTWDDVYASWSGTHGWVRDRWAAPGGDEAAGIAASIIAVVDQGPPESHFRLGINYYHQSTTGMAHTITNAVRPDATQTYERLYFASGLVCAPCHLSWVDERAEHAAGTTDLYLALMPTLFNSVGSSDSETMAITKWIVAGAHLEPELKLALKRAGLYASTMLWLWKAALPVEAEYGEEWRHRVAYAAVGDRFAFPGGYGAAGIERGDVCLDYHGYDDAAHLRSMVERAKSLRSAPPEAVVTLLDQQGGTTLYALKKTLCVLQEPGQEVVLRVSGEASFDLEDDPLELRWRLLHGQRATRVEREEGGAPVWTIRVPWDDALPEGRTTLLLLAHDGANDGNPAAVTIYRKRGDLPPSGGGYADYAYDAARSNRRPILLGLQDVAVRPGDTVAIPLRALDPERQPLRFAKRAGDPGELDGDLFTWKVPSREAPGTRALTLLCSDATAGNSYDARTIALAVKPRVLARIEADVLSGPAPLTVRFDSGGPKGEWAFAPRAPGRPAMPGPESTGARVTKTFEQPGIWEAWLRVRAGSEEHVARTTLLVTAQPSPAPEPARLLVEGEGAFVLDGDETPCRYDGTDFGSVPAKAREGALRTFLLHAAGDAPLRFARGAVAIEGEGAAAFGVVKPPRERVDARGSTALRLRFLPKSAGEHRAQVTIRAGELAVRFAVRGVAP